LREKAVPEGLQVRQRQGGFHSREVFVGFKEAVAVGRATSENHLFYGVGNVVDALLRYMGDLPANFGTAHGRKVYALNAALALIMAQTSRENVH
jgi:hypothetical protein